MNFTLMEKSQGRHVRTITKAKKQIEMVLTTKTTEKTNS